MKEKSTPEAQPEAKTGLWVCLYDLAERIAAQDGRK